MSHTRMFPILLLSHAVFFLVCQLARDLCVAARAGGGGSAPGALSEGGVSLPEGGISLPEGSLPVGGSLHAEAVVIHNAVMGDLKRALQNSLEGRPGVGGGGGGPGMELGAALCLVAELATATRLLGAPSALDAFLDEASLGESLAQSLTHQSHHTSLTQSLTPSHTCRTCCPLWRNRMLCSPPVSHAGRILSPLDLLTAVPLHC